MNTFATVYKSKYGLDGLIEELMNLVEVRPSSVQTWKSLSDALVEKKDYDEAIKVLKAAMKATNLSSSRILVSCLFEVYMAKGEHCEAVRLFERTIKSLGPINRSLQSKIFEAYQAIGNPDGAVMFFQSVIKLPNGEGQWAWPALMRAWAMKGDLEQATRKFEAAVEDTRIEPTPGLCYAILELYQAESDLDGAIKLFTKVVDSSPLDGWSWHILAEAHKMNADYTGAIKVCESALQCLSMDYSFHKCLCDLFLTISDPWKALQHYSSIKVLAPESFLWEHIHLRPISLHDNHKVVVAVDKSLREGFLWHSMGIVYKAIGEDPKACEIYDTVIGQYQLALDQKSNDLVMDYTGMNPFEGKSTVFQTYVDLPVVAVWSALGEAYKARGNIKAAYGAFQKAMELEPNNEWLCSMVNVTEIEIKRLDDM